MNTNISKTKYWHLNSVVREGRTWVNALICGILDLQGRNRSISANHNLTLKYKVSQVQGCPDLTVYISKFCVPWIRYLKSFKRRLELVNGWERELNNLLFTFGEKPWFNEVNPFVPNAHCLYSLKASENRKGALETNGLKTKLPSGWDIELPTHNYHF